MNKIIINSIVVASLVASGSLLAFAQTKNYNSSKSNTAVTEVREAVKDAVTERKEAVKEAVGQKREAVEVLKMERETAVKAAQEKKQEAFESLKAERAAAGKVSKEAFEQARETMKNAQDEFKAKIEVEREAFKTKAEAAKEELKTKRETEKAELKIKLEKIKDEKKKAAVERLDNRFTEINAKMAENWGNALSRMEELLGKVSSRADKAELNGKDVSAVRAAVEKAKVAIEAAKNSVVAQAAKTYPISVVDDVNLKSAVAAVREALNKDLAVVRNLAQAAKKSVADANSSLRAIPKIDELKETDSTN